MSHDSGYQIDITSSGRIVIDCLDPGNDKAVIEWAALYQPHGDSCHCRPSAPNNIAKTDCPNPTPCKHYHLPGPITNTISVNKEANVTITTHPPAA